MLMLIVTPFIGVDANDAHRWLEKFPPLAEQESDKHDTSQLPELRRLELYSHDFQPSMRVISVFMLFGVCFLMMFIGQLPFGKLAKLAGILMLALVLFLVLWQNQDTGESYSNQYILKDLVLR